MDLGIETAKEMKLEFLQHLNDKTRDEIRSKPEDRTVPSIIAYPATFDLLTNHERWDVTQAVRTAEFIEHEPFTGNTDEHNFGNFVCRDTKMYWTIDYFGLDLYHQSIDPLDISKTIRLLVVQFGHICCRKFPNCSC